MRNTSRLIAVGLATLVLAAPAFAGDSRRGHRDSRQSSSWRGDRHHHDHRVHVDRSPRVRTGVSITFGTGSYYRSSSYRSYGWPGYTRSHWAYSRPAYRPPVVVHRPLVVDRPVYVERPIVYEREIVREVPVYRDVVRANPTYRQAPPDPTARDRTGWSALASGSWRNAREYFDRQGVLRPDDPAPKLGLALARAAAEMDDQAEWAMRRAVRSGFDRAVRTVPVYDLDRLLSSLEVVYEDRSYTSNDRWFMLAAVRYVQGNMVGAEQAAGRALELDRHDDDARRLYDLARSSG